MSERILVDGELFLGRVDEQSRFRALLRESLEQRQAEEWSYVVLLHGVGGMGKTTLCHRLRNVAQGEKPFADRFEVLWVDWEERRHKDPARLAAREQVSFETVLDHLYAAFRDAGHGRAFNPFEKIRRQRVELEQQVEQDLAAIPAEGGERYALLRRIPARMLAPLLRRLPGAGLLLPQDDKTVQWIENFIQLGAEELAQVRSLGEKWLRARLQPQEYDLFVLPHEALAQAFARSVRAVTDRRRLLLFLDTYEIAGRADPWLRLVLRQSGPGAIWILSGRENLAESRPAVRFLGYHGEAPGGRLRVFPLGEFSVADVAAYFTECTPQRPPDPEQAAALHRATYGIPLAVKEAAAIWRQDKPLAEITTGIPQRAPREEIVRKMTERFMVHCLWDPARKQDRAQIYALAYRPDYDLLAAMLEQTNLGPLLDSLEEGYSFVFARRMALHQAVQDFMREYLLVDKERRSPAVRGAHQRAVACLEERRQRWEQDLPTLEQRVEDELWLQDTLALVHHRFWLEERAGWAALLTALPAGLAYERDFAQALLEAAEPLRATWTRAGRRRLKALQAGLGEWAGPEAGVDLLAELEAGRRHWPEDDCTEERAAILAWQRGRLAYRREQY